MMNNILEHINKAKEEFLKNGFEANTIIINEELARTEHLLIPVGDDTVFSFPPTILGLKVEYAKKLPLDANFIVTKTNKPKEDELEYYKNRCEELEQQLEQIKEILYER